MSQQNSLWLFTDPFAYQYADLSKHQSSTVPSLSGIKTHQHSTSKPQFELATHQLITAGNVPAAELKGTLCSFSAPRGTRYGTVGVAGASRRYELEASMCQPQVEPSISIPTTQVHQPPIDVDSVSYCAEQQAEGTVYCEKKSPVLEDAQVCTLRRQLAQVKAENTVLLRRSLMHNKVQSCLLEETNSLPPVVELHCTTASTHGGRSNSVRTCRADF
jgi:hypothetical protein